MEVITGHKQHKIVNKGVFDCAVTKFIATVFGFPHMMGCLVFAVTNST